MGNEVKKVLIFVDNAKRDLLSCVLIAEELKKVGIIPILSNKRDIILNLLIYKPDGLIMSRGDYPFVKKLQGLTKIFIYAGEGGRLTKESSLGSYIGYGRDALDNVDFIDKAFLWGNEVKSWLLETGFFNEDKLCVVGSNRLDLYSNKKEDKSKSKKRLTIGIGYTSKSTSSYEGMNKVPLDFFNMVGFTDTRLAVLKEGKGIEEYVWRDYAILRVFMTLLKRLMAETELCFSLRVGPFESYNAYGFLEKQYPGRIKIVNSDYPLPLWIDEVDTLLTCWSTLGLEFLVNKKPVIAMAYMINKERLLDSFIAEANGFNHLLPCYYTPENIDDCVAFFKEYEKKPETIEYSPDINKSKVLLKNLLNWPSDETSSKLIAKSIHEELKDYNAESNYKLWIGKLYGKGSKLRLLYTVLPFFRLYKIANFIRYFVKDLMSNNYKGNRENYYFNNTIIKKISNRYKGSFGRAKE